MANKYPYPLTREYEFMLKVRRDGRVLVGLTHPLLIGRVERHETHDGFAWFWSRDDFGDECQVAGHTRADAVEGLLRAAAKDAK